MFLGRRGLQERGAENSYQALKSSDAGQIRGSYAVAHLVGGGEQFVLLPRHKLDTIRKDPKTGGDGPWVTQFEGMCQKTAARALFEWLPVSIEAATAAALDEQADASVALKCPHVRQRRAGCCV